MTVGVAMPKVRQRRFGIFRRRKNSDTDEMNFELVSRFMSFKVNRHSMLTSVEKDKCSQVWPRFFFHFDRSSTQQ